LVAHHLGPWPTAGCRDVVMNCSWLADRLRAGLGDGRAWGVSIEYSPEPWPPLDTGGGIFHALPLLGADPVPVAEWRRLVRPRRPRSSSRPACSGICCWSPTRRTTRTGTSVWWTGRVEARGESALTYGGMAILSPELFAGCRPGRFPLAPILAAGGARQGRISGMLHSGAWVDVGTPERFYALQAKLGEALSELCEQRRLQIRGHPLRPVY
jgi:N-acetyl-alpha-D-muramate 1-phosphate uridylyltransferase